jgi:hypothetical protein
MFNPVGALFKNLLLIPGLKPGAINILPLGVKKISKL